MERRKIQSVKPYLAGPFVWMLLIPLVALDFFFEIYHHICFPLYGVPLIKRVNYIKIDRYKLEYLTLIEKVECAYCGYANGLLHYCVEIAGASEKFWCGIKHQQQAGFISPAHHADFVEYGDKAAFDKKYPIPQKEAPTNIRQILSKFIAKHLTGRHRRL